MILFVALMQAQIDGNVVRAKFTLPPRPKVSPPPKQIASATKRDAPKPDNAGADIERDAPKRPRECMFNIVKFLFNLCFDCIFSYLHVIQLFN